MRELINRYINGNATIELYTDGTRIIECDGDMRLDYPLNVDIRVSTQCSFGYNPKTGKSICSFCHESARTNGIECNYDELLNTLKPLPAGVELAIGSNALTPELFKFLKSCKNNGWVCNLTVNQGHLQRDLALLTEAINSNLIKGLGISFRSGMRAIPKQLIDYDNTVIHVINGIDSFYEVLSLKDQGIKKVLVLGEKDFGFNEGKVDLSSASHMSWIWNVHLLFKAFNVVSFDNLGLEQLDIKRLIKGDKWDSFYQGEFSFYINAVDKTFSPSSRSPDKVSWNIGLCEYFTTLEFK